LVAGFFSAYQPLSRKDTLQLQNELDHRHPGAWKVWRPPLHMIGCLTRVRIQIRGPLCAHRLGCWGFCMRLAAGPNGSADTKSNHRQPGCCVLQNPTFQRFTRAYMCGLSNGQSFVLASPLLVTTSRDS
jgi:hypothetical protein